MSWSKNYKRSIDCDNPKGFSQRAHCAGRKKREHGEKTKSKSPFNEMNQFNNLVESAVEELKTKLLDLDNISYNSIDHLMRHIMKKYDMTAKELHNAFVNKYHTTPDTWIKKQMNEDLRDWFGKGKEGGVGGGGWDRYNSQGKRIGKCARENPNEPKPKCLSKQKANQLRSQGGEKAIANAVRRKRKKDPISDRSGKGGNPIMVSNRIKEAKEEHRYCKLCGKMETRDECSWGGNFWDKYSIKGYNPTKPHPGNFPESFEINPSEHNKAKRQAKIANLLKGTKNIGEKEAAERKLNGPKLPSFKEEYIEEKNAPTNPSLWSRIKARAKSKFDVYPSAYANGWAAKEYKKAGGGWKTVKEDCWTGYVQNGMKKKGNKMVPNCVPSKKYQQEDVIIEDDEHDKFDRRVNAAMKSKDPETRIKVLKTAASIHPSKLKTFERFVSEAVAAWQRKEGKNPTGGLNKKGIASYRKEHPGSHLSLAVTTKPSKLKKGSRKWKRRKSFCARMSGMPGPMKDEKGRPTRKALSLRKWNC
jgi:hypothetical protein